ncbi:Hpt domain-containing protein [Alkalispirochaeta alkalica]|uniref:Hpt domain-containing protein n=1 Tax=Alkalispirochaeta alkalica TaxID=46356 RepID=UPI000590D4FD|nr:Hpt domain-containing protein [Alkalispirochaeta alkalica]
MTDESSQCVFDYEGFLVRVMADEELARTIALAFLEDTPRLIGKIATALETGDYESILRQAHTIKGASANLGGEMLCCAALELERSARKGDHQNCVDRLGALREAWDALAGRIRQDMGLA